MLKKEILNTVNGNQLVLKEVLGFQLISNAIFFFCICKGVNDIIKYYQIIDLYNTNVSKMNSLMKE